MHRQSLGQTQTVMSYEGLQSARPQGKPNPNLNPNPWERLHLGTSWLQPIMGISYRMAAQYQL